MVQLNNCKFQSRFFSSNCVVYFIFGFYLVSKIAAYTENLIEDGTSTTELMNYMKKFGYLPTPPSSSLMGQLISGDEVKNSIKMVQRIAKVKETGILDDATAKYIKRPRCGNNDTSLISHVKELNRRQSSSGRRGRRYAINQYNLRWKKQDISWRLHRLTGKVSESVVRQEMQKAFYMWSEASNLRFHYQDNRDRNSEADIIVSFETGNHGDGNHFDGPGGVLAHAFTPSGSDLAGDLHFDDAENWKSHYDSTKNPDTTTSLLWTATHELGHSLGLDHSDDQTAIMYPQYMGGSEPLDKLPYDDKIAIQVLYDDFRGQPFQPIAPTRRTTTTARTTTTTRTPTTTTRHRHTYTHKQPNKTPIAPRTNFPTKRPITQRPQYPTERTTTTESTLTPTTPFQQPDICRLIFDAIAAIRGELYIFKGTLLWKISTDGSTYGPTSIHTFWIGLPKDIDKIDAAYEKQIDNFGITLFSGDRFWVFNGHYLLPNYPRRLSDLGLPRDMTHLDGVLAWGHKGKTFFFSKDKYWRFNEEIQRVDEGYPKTMDCWKGVQFPISSTFRWKDGKTYFFKDRVYWSFNDTKMELDHPIGRITSSFWFNCPEQYKRHAERDNSVDRPQNRQQNKSTQTADEESEENSCQTISQKLSIIILFILINYLNLLRS